MKKAECNTPPLHEQCLGIRKNGISVKKVRFLPAMPAAGGLARPEIHASDPTRTRRKTALFPE
jgi:hypothetical protein